jgi:hypothetical protein
MNVKKQILSIQNNPKNKQNENKIELLSCNSGAENCKEHLLIINRCYVEANTFHQEKDYLNSIESLKNAFLMSCDLRHDSCSECANLFRATITKSLENINDELYRLTTGILKNKRYIKSYKESCAVLNDIKKELKQII